MADPCTYVSTCDIQKRWALSVINDFAEDLKKMSGKCMDIGCGPGNITRDILLPALDSNARIIGTDISKNMIEYANKVYGKNQLMKFEILNIETEDLPRKYVSEFDHLFSFHAIHWCKDIRKAFENMYCMLRPGGTILILFVACHETIEECFKVLQQNKYLAACIQYEREYLSPFHFLTRPKEKLAELLEDVGFKVYHCSIRDAMLTVKDIETLHVSLFSLFLNNASHEEKEKFEKEFKRIYEETRIKIRGKDIHSCLDKNQQETIIIDEEKVLVAYAQKSSL